MIVAIDTSSLVTLVRYYLPFDTNGILYEFVKRKVESGYIRIIDKVFEECQYTSKGIVIDALDYIKKHQIRTTDILPNRKFFNQLEYNFINGSAKNKLTSIEFEARKGRIS